MATWRWRTSGVPASTAFFPLLTKTAGTWQRYKENVSGDPGTLPVPAPNLSIPSSPLLLGERRSSDAPPVWYPQLWFETALSETVPAGGNDAGVRIYSDNQLPVPAIEPQRGTHRLGGGHVVQPFQDPHRRAVTRRSLMNRHA